MYLRDTAKQMFLNGYTLDQVRSGLRATTTISGDSPTNSYVEEVLRAVIRERERKHAQRRRYRDNKKVRRAALMTVEPVMTDSVLTPNGRVYKVTGERVHFVTANPPALTTCDCGNSASPCSHVIAVTKSLTVPTMDHIVINKIAYPRGPRGL